MHSEMKLERGIYSNDLIIRSKIEFSCFNRRPISINNDISSNIFTKTVIFMHFQEKTWALELDVHYKLYRNGFAAKIHVFCCNFWSTIIHWSPFPTDFDLRQTSFFNQTHWPPKNHHKNHFCAIFTVEKGGYIWIPISVNHAVRCTNFQF